MCTSIIPSTVFVPYYMCTSHLHPTPCVHHIYTLPHVYITCTLHLCVHHVDTPPMCVHLHTTHLHCTPCVHHIYTSPSVYITFTPHPCVHYILHLTLWVYHICTPPHVYMTLNDQIHYVQCPASCYVWTRMEAGDVLCPHVCILRAVSWFHASVSFLVLLLSPLALSVLSFFNWWSILLTFPPRIFSNTFR